jgi:hypothetical protein
VRPPAAAGKDKDRKETRALTELCSPSCGCDQEKEREAACQQASKGKERENRKPARRHPKGEREKEEASFERALLALFALRLRERGRGQAACQLARKGKGKRKRENGAPACCPREREREKLDARFDRALLALLPLRPRERGRVRLPASLQREGERTERPPAVAWKEKERKKTPALTELCPLFCGCELATKKRGRGRKKYQGNNQGNNQALVPSPLKSACLPWARA